MAFKITIGGVEVACDTAPEAAELVRELSTLTGTARASARPATRRTATRRTARRRRHRGDSGTAIGRALAMIELLAQHSEGLKTDEIVEALGLNGGRSLSGFKTTVGPILAEHGVDIGEVFTRDRMRKGSRWSLGPSADDALTILEAQRNGGASP